MHGSTEPPVHSRDPEREPLRLVEVAVVCAVWAFFAFLNLLFVAFTARDGDAGGGMSLVTEARHVILPTVWALLTIVVLWASRYVRIDRAFWRQRALAVIGVSMIIAFGTDMLTDALWDAIVPASIEAGRNTISRRFRPGVANFSWLDDLGVFWAAVAIGSARGYVLRERERRNAERRHTDALRAEAAQLQMQLVAARLDALQRQMDPHFLFNTLNAVSALVERDPHGVRQMVAELSDLLRYSMSTTTAPEVPLREELALLERYTSIMQIRFAEQLRLVMRVDDETLDAIVPNLILQPLVENAIRHGVEHRADGGQITVEALRDAGQLVLRVHDEGPDFLGAQAVTSPRSDGGVGLQNTASRLAALYGDSHSLTLTAASAGGTVAEIRLPFRTHARPSEFASHSETGHA